jgi:hypothetical protein
MSCRSGLAFTIVALVGGMLWIEAEHRVVLDAPTTQKQAARAAGCADNDDVPYTAGCLAFLGDAPPTRWRVRSIENTAQRASAPERVEPMSIASTSACPDTDNVPYTARCVRYLSGWFWQPYPADGRPGG